MNLKYINEIKKLESPPKIIKLFSSKEIKDILDLYFSLPERTFNKKQNIRKKVWIQNYNKELDKIYFNKLKNVLGDFKMDTLKSESGEDFYGIFHESFSPLTLHVDSGFDENTIIYKQIITPLYSFGGTVFFKNRWYGKSTSFTVDKDELNFKPGPGQNFRSNKHLGDEEFDKKTHAKHLSHININNLKGLEVDFIYNWKVGETVIVDRTHIHCATSNIENKKIGLTTFTKK